MANATYITVRHQYTGVVAKTVTGATASVSRIQRQPHSARLATATSTFPASTVRGRDIFTEAAGKNQKIPKSDGAVAIQIIPRFITRIAPTRPEYGCKENKVGKANLPISIKVGRRFLVGTDRNLRCERRNRYSPLSHLHPP